MMVERQEITPTKLGPTRTGLQKTGYRITPGALHWIADALETQELMALVRQHEKSLPLSASLIERAIRSTGDPSEGPSGGQLTLRFRTRRATFDDYFGSLLLSVLWDLEFDDPDVQREFVGEVIRAAAEANADVMEGKDFASSMGSIIEEESRFLANATSTLAIVKDAGGETEPELRPERNTMARGKRPSPRYKLPHPHNRMNHSIDYEDMLFHALFIGSTGAGKTNALLYWLRKLFSNRKDVALVLIDPHGDAAIDLVRLIPKSERERITILDPTYVSFGLNPLSLPAGAEGANRVQILQTQVEELSALLSDVFNTDAANAPRLMWVFKGALYYLYTLDDNPTFRDLYRILVDFISMPRSEIECDAQEEGSWRTR